MAYGASLIVFGGGMRDIIWCCCGVYSMFLFLLLSFHQRDGDTSLFSFFGFPFHFFSSISFRKRIERERVVSSIWAFSY